jgi:hypothetical protein
VKYIHRSRGRYTSSDPGASGNLTPAPECQRLASGDHIAPGARINTDEASTIGTEHYQCCIHPWMRADVTVVP